MLSYFKDTEEVDLIYLYSILSKKHFELIKSYQFSWFSERFFTKNIAIYSNPEHTVRVANEPNNYSIQEDLFIMKFLYLKQTLFDLLGYKIENKSYGIICKDQLEAFNSGIIGYIELFQHIEK